MKTIALVLFTFFTFHAIAQENYEYVQKGEFGISAGMAHYFGDLNTRAGLNRPKPAVGVFFRKQFGNYIAARINAHYAQVGYSDTYSKNEYQNTRNLSFNSNIWELALQGDFNFFKFIPGSKYNSFTPFVTLGVGAFSYDPYAYLNGKKEFLRPLGTEGQLIGYKGRKQYSPTAICFPIGVGIKYNISDNLNLSFEVTQRITNTDYLDDVSTTYIGVGNFVPGSSAALLQDRSYEVTTPVLGVEGRQRGWSKQKDQYIIAELSISFNISSYKCPSAN
ncbi:MAG: outer membrane beta-barrel protein [Chitinophagaceae bacterium]|nr:outer membrane beta-barrel protein [Chitinophagaceae bacterium]